MQSTFCNQFLKFHFNIIILSKSRSSNHLIASCWRTTALHAILLSPNILNAQPISPLNCETSVKLDVSCVLFGDKLSLVDDLTRAALGVVGRFGVGIAYNAGTQYAAELVPTEVRGQGVGLIHVAGFAATFFSPHILYLVGSCVALRRSSALSENHPCALTYFHPFCRITFPALKTLRQTVISLPLLSNFSLTSDPHLPLSSVCP